VKFKTRIYDVATGLIEESLQEANSVDELHVNAHRSGKRVMSARRSIRVFSHPQQSADEYPLFCQELQTLLRAGMTVVEAIDILCLQTVLPFRNKLSTQALANNLKTKLENGQSLSASLTDLGNAPAVLVASIKSVEKTSNLLEALDDYLKYHQLMTQLRSKIVSAAIYPGIVTILGVGITIFLMMVVMPNFANMYENLRGTPKGLSSIIIGLSQYLSLNRTGVAFSLLFGAAALTWWINSGHARQQIIRLAFQSSWTRIQIENYQLALFYQTLHLLSKGGYPVPLAMTIARDAALSDLMRARVSQAHAAIEKGKAIAQSMYENGLASEVDRRLIAAAERNGDFSRVANTVSGLHREQFEVFVERLTRIIEPVLLLAVALLVGTVVVLMYMPVFEMGAQWR
jgi:general secretion pathway protein F